MHLHGWAVLACSHVKDQMALQASMVCGLQAEIPEGTEATQQSVSCTRHWDPRPECGSVKRGLNACSSSTFGMSLAVAFVAGATALYAAH